MHHYTSEVRDVYVLYGDALRTIFRHYASADTGTSREQLNSMNIDEYLIMFRDAVKAVHVDITHQVDPGLKALGFFNQLKVHPFSKFLVFR